MAHLCGYILVMVLNWLRLVSGVAGDSDRPRGNRLGCCFEFGRCIVDDARIEDRRKKAYLGSDAHLRIAIRPTLQRETRNQVRPKPMLNRPATHRFRKNT